MTGTLPETNMETQKGAYKDYSLSKRGYMGFHVSLGEGICLDFSSLRFFLFLLTFCGLDGDDLGQIWGGVALGFKV